MQARKNSLAVFLILLSCCSQNLFGRSTSSGFVYVMTNDPAGNTVIQYQRSGGSLTQLSEAATGGLGGTGNGVGPLDPLGSQDSLVLSGDGSFVLAVNAGSNQVSALSASSSGLRLLNTVSSSGDFPNSVALHGDLVYVLNAHGTPNISGFRLSSTGLTPIAGSTVSLPGGSASGPHDIRYSPDGTRLLVTEGNTNKIDIFELSSSGLVTGLKSQSSAGLGPFGMKFGRDDLLFNSEATTNSVSSYLLTSSDTLNVISAAVPDGQQATCWISFTGDGKFAFVSNTASGNLSSYAIDIKGTVNLAQPVAATAAGGNPIDSAFSSDSVFLFVDDSSMGRILIYSVHGASLKLIGTVPGLPTTLQGVAAQ